MFDRIEAEYEIGEYRAYIKKIEDEVLPPWDAQVKHLKQQKEEVEAELKEAKKKLADAMTKRGEVLSVLENCRHGIRELEEQLPLLLTEPEAVDILKKARVSGKFDFKKAQYSTELLSDAQRFWNSIFTLDGTILKEIAKRDEYYVVTITKFDNVYREFLYGDEEAEAAVAK